MACVLAAPKPQVQKRSFTVERVANPNFKRHVNHKRAPGAGTRAIVKAYRKFGVKLPDELLSAMGAAGSAGTGSSVGGVNDDLAGLLSGSIGAASGEDQDEGDVGAATKTETSAAPAGGQNSAGTPPSNSTNGSGVVVNTPEKGDIEYLSPVNIGGQTVYLDFDTGSSDLWVFNSQLAASSITGHQIYNPSKSASFKTITGATYSILYGDGSGSSGTVGTDVVNIGGVSVASQAVELPTALSASFVEDMQSDGLVGFAFSILNTVRPAPQKTFFENVIPSLAEPVFTADLRAAAPGAYSFGKVDSTKFNGSLSWAAVNTTRGFWQFSSSKFSVGNGHVMTVADGQAIADTGTTLMLADPTLVNAYYSEIQGAVNNASLGGVTFPCNSVLPDLQIDIGGNYMANIRGNDMNFAPVDTAETGMSSLRSLSMKTLSQEFSHPTLTRHCFLQISR